MPNKYSKLAEEVGVLTDAQFVDKFSSLTRLNNEEIENIIKETKIDPKELAAVLEIVKNATASNEQQAKAIQNIGKGVEVLTSIVKKFI